jgi:hypothetical protein
MQSKNKYIVFVLAALVLVSCGVKKKAVSTLPSVESEPTWHTCLIQNAKATVTMDGSRMSANVTMQTVRDSMLVISVMPLLGIEVARFEVTPFELTGINKFDGTYATTTFAELNRTLTPSLNWDVLQQTCTAELPTGAERARLVYTLGDKEIELVINYTPRKLDVPVRVLHQNVSKYKKMNIQKWL